MSGNEAGVPSVPFPSATPAMHAHETDPGGPAQVAHLRAHLTECGQQLDANELLLMPDAARAAETPQLGGAPVTVLLCWYHHRNIDSNEWHFQMVAGLPEVLAPPWIDPHQVWRKTRPPLRTKPGASEWFLARVRAGSG